MRCCAICSGRGSIPTAVYLEVFFGAIQNLINVTGDVVTVAIEEKHVWK